MKLLDVYIGGSFLKCFFLIMLVLAILFSLLELLAQLDDVGKGRYELTDALVFVAFTLPRRMLDLMPISTLLAGVVAMGLIADHGELIAMQASGISDLRICSAVLATGMLLMVGAGLLAEWAVPGMEQTARMTRARALSSTGVTFTTQGFWARRENGFIHVAKNLGNGLAADIDIFEFDDQDRLTSLTHAHSAFIQDNRQWDLRGITRKTLTDQGIAIDRPAGLTLEEFLSVDQVGVLELPPDSLSTPDLMQYVRALQTAGQNAAPYSLALWRKLSVPLTTGAMVLLSLSFIFGSTRGMSAGRRITMGALVGIAVYFADQLLMHLGLLLNLPPLVTAMTPVLLISGVAALRLRMAF